MRGSDMKVREAVSDRGAPGRGAWLRAGLTLRLRALGTPPRRIALSMIRDGGGGEASLKNSRIGCISRGTANLSGGDGSIRKNIIGHGMGHGAWHGTGRGMSVRAKQSFTRGVFRDARRPLALLDQPAGEHGAGIFFEPLVE
jgi:hypothetical protein